MSKVKDNDTVGGREGGSEARFILYMPYVTGGQMCDHAAHTGRSRGSRGETVVKPWEEREKETREKKML